MITENTNNQSLKNPFCVNVSDLKVRFLGQSGFQLTKGNSTILIDPADKKAGDIEGDLVLVRGIVEINGGRLRRD